MSRLDSTEQRILLFSVFFLSLCGIIYELVLGSLATYLLGNPVQQYSITIGVFLSSMGLGSFLSRYINGNLVKNFILIEALLGFTGGICVILLTYLFSFSTSFYLLHVFFLIIIGTLVGLEIPLLTRIMKKYGSLKEVLSNILTLDYLGGLAGSLLFPLVLFPFAGRFLTSLIIGMINISVALYIIYRIDYTGKRKSDYLFPVLALILLIGLTANSGMLTDIIHKRLYSDDIVFSKRSKYQEIVLTRNGSDFRLYLDGALQFSTFDEYRYHEMLILPAMHLSKISEKKVLVLGGGDGLAVNQILKNFPSAGITLVELDQAIIDLAKNNSSLKRVNNSSLSDKRVKVVVGDAYTYLLEKGLKFNVIIADFPDPHDETISKLYTVEFFKLIARSLDKDGIFVTQSTSPLFAKDAFWCINKTLSIVFKTVIPYHIYIPTFGDWGFNIASKSAIDTSSLSEAGSGKYFSPETFSASMVFSKDSIASETEINTFNRPILYNYYIKGWKDFDL